MIQKRFSLLLIWILVSFAGQAQGESTSPYSFDKNGIQKEVLENYLDRSITVTNLLVPNQGEEQLNDDIRMIQISEPNSWDVPFSCGKTNRY